MTRSETRDHRVHSVAACEADAWWVRPSGFRRAAIHVFVVTSLPSSRFDKKALYEELYCARGDMENRIKEQQLDLFADRTSTATMAGNQMRLYWASFAYVLMAAMRRFGLAGTPLARAQCGTIRLKLLKVAAQLRITHRRIWLALPSAFPWQSDFAAALDNPERDRSTTRPDEPLSSPRPTRPPS